MRKQATAKLDDTLSDRRLAIAKMILEAPADRVGYLLGLFPEFFGSDSTIGSYEYVVSVNTSYQKWIENAGITKNWLKDFPTMDIYNHYLRYTVDNRMLSMSKKLFFEVLEIDFNLRE